MKLIPAFKKQGTGLSGAPTVALVHAPCLHVHYGCNECGSAVIRLDICPVVQRPLHQVVCVGGGDGRSAELCCLIQYPALPLYTEMARLGVGKYKEPSPRYTLPAGMARECVQH